MTDHTPDTNLPPVADPKLNQISDRLHEYNQTIQEQAFLLGFRNGFREGEGVQRLLSWVERQHAKADTREESLIWRDVKQHLIGNGAYPEDPEAGEITHPPGLNAYVGAADCRPHLQVAGKRIPIEDFRFDWDPAPNAPEGKYDGFDPQAETAEITLSFDVELPEDSEAREAMMEFLDGIR